MDDEKVWVNISVKGSIIRRLPLKALKSSDVLYKMATCGMKESISEEIILEEDSPVSLEIYCRLSVLWILDEEIFPRGSYMRLRTLRKDEFHDLVDFLDKYQVCGTLWFAIQRSIESYLDDEALISKMVKFESKNPNVVWTQTTINRLAKDKSLEIYTDLFGIYTTRRLLSAVINTKNS